MIRNFIALLTVLFTVSLLGAPKAEAVALSGQSIRLLASQFNISSNSWTVLLQNVPKSFKGVYFTNFTSNPLSLGIALQNATWGTEVPQIVLPITAQNWGAFNTGTFANNATVGNPGMYVPMTGSQGVRLSVSAFNSSCTTGELDLSILFN